MKFTLKEHNYIVCPKCKNDTNFECFGDRLDYGVYEIKIRCCKCDWISDELYEECGYYPDLSKDAIRYHAKTLHDMQQEELFKEVK